MEYNTDANIQKEKYFIQHSTKLWYITYGTKIKYIKYNKDGFRKALGWPLGHLGGCFDRRASSVGHSWVGLKFLHP